MLYYSDSSEQYVIQVSPNPGRWVLLQVNCAEHIGI